MKQHFANLLKLPYRAIVRVCEHIEANIIKKEVECQYSPLFIVGLPRSGSTLLYQLVTYCFAVCYLNNVMARCRFPCFTSYVTKEMNGCTPTYDFNSWYGETKGWRSPAAGWLFWDTFFKTGQMNYLDEKGLEHEMGLKLRKTILLMQHIFDKPFVNKSQSIPVRILPINKFLPESLFVRIYRDHVDIAQSVLKGRKDKYHNTNHWFSAKPSRYSELADKDHITQICGQIFYLEKDMDRDLGNIGQHRCLNVSYKELCHDPLQVCLQIERFYNANTVSRTIRIINSPPANFDFSTGKKCNDEEYQRLMECLEYFNELSQP